MVHQIAKAQKAALWLCPVRCNMDIVAATRCFTLDTHPQNRVLFEGPKRKKAAPDELPILQNLGPKQGEQDGPTWLQKTLSFGQILGSKRGLLLTTFEGTFEASVSAQKCPPNRPPGSTVWGVNRRVLGSVWRAFWAGPGIGPNLPQTAYSRVGRFRGENRLDRV
jgi:hypothetical protein